MLPFCSVEIEAEVIGDWGVGSNCRDVYCACSVLCSLIIFACTPLPEMPMLLKYVVSTSEGSSSAKSFSETNPSSTIRRCSQSLANCSLTPHCKSLAANQFVPLSFSMMASSTGVIVVEGSVSGDTTTVSLRMTERLGGMAREMLSESIVPAIIVKVIICKSSKYTYNEKTYRRPKIMLLSLRCQPIRKLSAHPTS